MRLQPTLPISRAILQTSPLSKNTARHQSRSAHKSAKFAVELLNLRSDFLSNKRFIFVFGI